MDTDFSVELGDEDPVLDFPWTDASGRLAYVDLKRHPELLAQVEEAKELPELAEFLRCVNSPRSVVESAKCDVWATRELAPEEEIVGASHKFASYVDLVLSHTDRRQSLAEHERFAERLVALLRRPPEISSSAEVCVRRCFFGAGCETHGFYFTVYVNGYGDEEASARQNWMIGMKRVRSAIVQLSAEK
ncbi:MAG TPA: hypothetical protein VEK84_17995 [Terriglobales bacterium]|nr:hypothetical protein [Terriglobales bacterium]